VVGGVVVLVIAIEGTAKEEAAEGEASDGEAARRLLRLNRRKGQIPSCYGGR
jgi:hypothetical protein